MSDDYIDTVNSYSSFKTTFNATSIQSQPMLMSDIFDVSIDFIWNTPDIAKGNAAFLKIKYFLEEKMHHSILTYKDAPSVLKHLENEVIMFPYVPTNDIIAVTLHAKLNAIADGAIEIIAIKVQNTNTQPIMGYTYADSVYPQLPTMKDWVEGDYYYDKHGGSEIHLKLSNMKLMKIQT